MSAQPRKRSRHIQKSLACAPLNSMYLDAESARARAWSNVEADFLQAMEAFDIAVASGATAWGDRQNGKGDFFNDLLALLLENCSGADLYSRSSVPGLIFRKHHLDCTYPATGAAQFRMEAKAVGLPKHPDSPKQKDHGRPGSADLEAHQRGGLQGHRPQGRV